MTNNKKSLVDVLTSLKRAEGAAREDFERAAKWDTKYINSLPDAAFAVIEKGYSIGKAKGARHLPHHDKSVKSPTENKSVDLPHYRNALARAGQIKSVLGKESDSSLRKRAAAHLAKHRAVLQKAKSNFNAVEKKIWVECERLFELNIVPFLKK